MHSTLYVIGHAVDQLLTFLNKQLGCVEQVTIGISVAAVLAPRVDHLDLQR